MVPSLRNKISYTFLHSLFYSRAEKDMSLKTKKSLINRLFFIGI
jgi:hypothetical protein